MQPQPTQQQIVAAVSAMQSDRDHLRRLLARVADAVLDQTPDGMSIAYLPADLLREIRALRGF